MSLQLRDFIESERKRFATRHNNIFAFNFSEIARYHDYLPILLQRHNKTGAQYLDVVMAFQNGIDLTRGGPLTKEQIQRFEELRALAPLLLLEAESFYLFAKILLDRIARGIEFYFGQVKLKNHSLDSHDDLVKRIDKYAGAKELTLPDGFVDFARRLKEDICDFRDYQIAHHKSPRTLRAAMYDQGGNIRIHLSQIFPTDKDKQVETKILEDLLGAIDNYVRLTIDLIQLNHDGTALELSSS